MGPGLRQFQSAPGILGFDFRAQECVEGEYRRDLGGVGNGGSAANRSANFISIVESHS
jgi:hypothetical protein